MSDSEDDEAFRAAREAAKRAKSAGGAPPPPPSGTAPPPPSAAGSAATAVPGAPSAASAVAASGAGASSAASKPKAGLAAIAAANVRRDAAGRTIVMLTTYEDFSATRTYSGSVEKTAKYTKKWVKRWITLCDLTLTYALQEGAPAKHTMTLNKCSRGQESGHEANSILIECSENGNPKATELLLRTETARMCELWYLRFCHALSHYSLCDMPKDGVPVNHPKTGLPFIDIPNDRLKNFGPVDKLALHFFGIGKATVVVEGKDTVEKRAVLVGDLSIVICETDANVRRCIPIKDVQRVMSVSSTQTNQQPAGAAPGPPLPAAPASSNEPEVTYVGLQCNMPEYDVMLAFSPEQAEDFIAVVSVLHEHFGTPPGVKPIILKRERLAKVELMRPQLSLDANEFYQLRVHLPMSKKLLAKMVQEGVKKGQLVTHKSMVSLGDVAFAVPGGGGVVATGASAMPPNTLLPPAPNAGGSSLLGPSAAPAAAATTSPVDMGGSGVPAAPAGNPSNPLDRTTNPLGAQFGASASPQKPPVGIIDTTASSSSPRNGVNIAPGVDKMHRLLNHIGLGQYYQTLVEKHVDWEVFCCMDALDLRAKGVTAVEHQIRIENALNDASLMSALNSAGGGGPGMPPPPPSNGGFGMPPPPPPAPGGFGASSGGFGGAPPPPPPPASRAVANFIDDDDL